ncbi:MAG: flagellar biosynthesis anti-sigma factor FlgM [Thermotaleaceae bacterium]
MKISNNPSIQKVVNSYKKNIEGASKGEKLKQGKDKVEISEEARSFQVALNAFKKLPDIRNERVEEISKKIHSGNYNPSAEEVVNSIFDKKI